MYRAGPSALESWISQVRTPLWPSSFKETKVFLPGSLVMIQQFRLFVQKGGRHTDTYFIDIKKRLFCHKNDRVYVYVHVYIQVG